jgi:hypothetical protein
VEEIAYKEVMKEIQVMEAPLEILIIEVAKVAGLVRSW